MSETSSGRHFSFVVRLLRTQKGEVRGHLIEALTGVRHPFGTTQSLVKLVERLASGVQPYESEKEDEL
ncbi:MAG: hypothetical protein DWQ07_08520 [Chloroflexi bacterium]|nr:MAG: hypothetical protein DWQ07_08520 [Chloroflexota bacterium]MBL1193244.1 hypothetical protein [Chloroflexota bacterium]